MNKIYYAVYSKTGNDLDLGNDKLVMKKKRKGCVYYFGYLDDVKRIISNYNSKLENQIL